MDRPEHLQAEISSRNMAYMPPVANDPVGELRVFESSNALGEWMRLSLSCQPDLAKTSTDIVTAAGHFPVTEALKVSDQIRFMAARFHTGRPTAMIRDKDDQPLDRDAYAEHLESRLQNKDDDDSDVEGPRLNRNEGQVIAGLLDELAGEYRGEPLGTLARSMAVRLYDRMGI